MTSGDEAKAWQDYISVWDKLDNIQQIVSERYEQGEKFDK